MEKIEDLLKDALEKLNESLLSVKTLEEKKTIENIISKVLLCEKANDMSITSLKIARIFLDDALNDFTAFMLQD